MIIPKRLICVLFAGTWVAACAPGGGGVVEPIIEAPVIVQESAVPIAAPRPTSPVARAPQRRTLPPSGVLTAGDIDDGLNLSALMRYQTRAARHLKWQRMNLSKPVLAQLVGPTGAPAPGVRFTLRHPGATDPFHDGYSGVDGMITAFPAVLDARRSDRIELRAFPTDDGPATQATLRTNGRRTIVALDRDHAWQPQFVDLVFVVDTTGSMTDEIEWLISDLGAIVKATAKGVVLRLGLVTYKSRGDVYTVRDYGFAKNRSQFQRWLQRELPTSGGGGYPEAVAQSLKTAVDLPWRRGRGERLIIQIGDEPPHHDQVGVYYTAVQNAAVKGVQVFGLAASGAEAKVEFLMRQGAVATGGRYMFLTDDSGVGNAHAEPTVSCYRVTSLTNLMTRVLRSELTGRRIEAASNAVKRSVGSYAGGVCRS